VFPVRSVGTRFKPPRLLRTNGGSHEADILTFILDFKELGQATTFDIFGNEVSTFDVASYGFSSGDFNTVANGVLAEVDVFPSTFDVEAGCTAGVPRNLTMARSEFVSLADVVIHDSPLRGDYACR
jgi:hypothetical protein